MLNKLLEHAYLRASARWRSVVHNPAYSILAANYALLLIGMTNYQIAYAVCAACYLWLALIIHT
jgi:hypothetical protein